MDEFITEPVRRSTDQKVTCPRQECGQSFRVSADWPGKNPYKTRMCPWCSSASSIPGFGALVYDGHDTLIISVAERDALLAVGLIQYSPGDGPYGIMYRPTNGLSANQVERKLAR